MQISDLAIFLDRLEKTSSRLEITAILSELFKKTSPAEIDKVTYLSLGILAPNYEGVILSVAEKMMIRVLTEAYSIKPEEVNVLYKKSGDLGDVAEELATKADKNKTELTVNDVYLKLLAIAKDTGEGSQERKVQGMSELIRGLDSLSVRFVSRIPVGKLRLGFSEKTVIDALSDGTKANKKEIEEAYNIRPDIGYIAKLAKEGNIRAAKPEVGVPVVPMLAQRLNSAGEMIKKMGEVSVEPKFDGLRIFIHFRKKDNFLKIFTRNMNSIPVETFPELNEFGKFINAEEVILDTEAIGVDPEREMFLDFQKTIQRRRKHEVEKSSAEIPLQFQVFDILLLNGKSMIQEPYLKRREAINKTVENGKLLRVDDFEVTSEPEVIRSLHQKYLKMNLEGVVVKKANAPYVSGRAGWNWVKMKEVEGSRGKLSDTLDCVIMGYTTGKGKRVDFGVGQFLAGVKDGDNFKTITKVGTGLSDGQFRELNLRLSKIKSKVKPKQYEVHNDLTPDFWVFPEVVVELAADEITISPKHTAGYALRFPRLVRFRDDKNAKDITDIRELGGIKI
jgi:DNA ligase-1